MREERLEEERLQRERQQSVRKAEKKAQRDEHFERVNKANKVRER